MPANRGVSGPHWTPSPDFRPSYSQLNTDESYIPTTFDDAVGYIMQAGLREIADYEGYPDIQRETAEDIARLTYDEPATFKSALAEYVESNVSDISVNDELRAQALFKAMQQRRPRNTVTQLATVVLLREDLATGEKTLESKYIERQRSFA